MGQWRAQEKREPGHGNRVSIVCLLVDEKSSGCPSSLVADLRTRGITDPSQTALVEMTSPINLDAEMKLG
jgi:hypothetical protein